MTNNSTITSYFPEGMPLPGPMPDGPPAQSNRMMWKSSCIPPFYPREATIITLHVAPMRCDVRRSRTGHIARYDEVSEGE